MAPRLQAAVAALSAGPVAIGDKIGLSDVPLIMRSCRKVLVHTIPPYTLFESILGL